MECKCSSGKRETCDALAAVRESLQQIQEFLSDTVRPVIEKSQEETNPFAEDLASEEALPPPPPGVLTVSSSMPSLATPSLTTPAQHSTKLHQAPPPPVRTTPVQKPFVPSQSSIVGALSSMKKKKQERRELAARLAMQSKEAQSQERI